MYTTIGYYESQESAVLVNIAALADSHVRVSGDDVIVPKGMNFLLGYRFGGPNFTQGRLDSPSIRRVCPIDVEPAELSLEPGSPPQMHDLFENPIKLDETEALNALMAEDATGASAVVAVVFLGDKPVTKVTGDIRTIRATATATLAANAWTNVAITFAQTLPAGRYQVVGLRAQSAGMIAARLQFPGGTWRPGVLGCDSDADLDHPRFRNGNAGVIGEFDHDAPPTIDCLSASADTAEVFHFDLIKTG